MRFITKVFNKLNGVLDTIQIKKAYSQFEVLAAKSKSRFELSEKNMWPILNEATVNTEFDRHYIYHPAWAIRKVREINPSKHIDVSSILQFSTMLSAFYKTEFYDYRPAQVVLSNLESKHQDLTKLSFESNSIESLSCMHTIEHVGLGRYGDALDYDGDVKALSELSRVLKPGGHLLLVTPIGHKALISFNAHRVYSKELLFSMCQANNLEVKEFTLIPEKAEDGGLVENPSQLLLNKQNYGCACLWLVKKAV